MKLILFVSFVISIIIVDSVMTIIIVLIIIINVDFILVIVVSVEVLQLIPLPLLLRVEEMKANRGADSGLMLKTGHDVACAGRHQGMK